LTVRLDLAAKQEIHQAALFYEDCREGLGQEFVDSVESAFEQIQQHPTVWRILKGRFRRYLLQRFPYGIIYAVEGKVIYIAAVMHLKRKPGYWVSRGKA
jgi:plasmid stabilization system protein ParE